MWISTLTTIPQLQKALQKNIMVLCIVTMKGCIPCKSKIKMLRKYQNYLAGRYPNMVIRIVDLKHFVPFFTNLSTPIKAVPQLILYVNANFEQYMTTDSYDELEQELDIVCDKYNIETEEYLDAVE